MKAFYLISLLMLAPPGHAQSVYKWTDEDGEVHYSQTLPPERVAGAHDRLTRDGRVAERVDRVRTDDERAALKAEQEMRREADEQQRLQAQQDRLFLAAFPTAQDVRQGIERRRETVLAERDAVETLIERNRAGFFSLIERAAALERRGQPVPEATARRIDDTRDDLDEFSQRLAEIDARLEALDAELAAELERHRRLSESG